MIKGIFALALFFSLYCSTVIADSSQLNDKQIYTTHSKYQDYYHIKFTLTPSNTILTLNNYNKYGPSKYEFNDGLFEVFIPKDAFPISAPNCKEYIILRMPMTLASDRNKWIEEKRALFNRIKAMKDTGKGEIEIIIELNPYVKVKNNNPLEL